MRTISQILLLVTLAGYSQPSSQLHCHVRAGALILHFTGIGTFLKDENTNSNNNSSIVIDFMTTSLLQKNDPRLNPNNERNFTRVTRDDYETMQVHVEDGVLYWKIGYIFDTEFFSHFRITRTTDIQQKDGSWVEKEKALSSFDYPKPQNESVDTWKDGFKFGDIEKCIEDADSEYIVKADCRTLSLMRAEKLYTKRTDFGEFEVDGLSFDFYKTSTCNDYLCRYEGDILQPDAYNNVCLKVRKNRREQKICKSVYAHCPVAKRHNNTDDVEGGRTSIASAHIMTIVFGIALVISGVVNCYLHHNLKRLRRRETRTHPHERSRNQMQARTVSQDTNETTCGSIEGDYYSSIENIYEIIQKSTDQQDTETNPSNTETTSNLSLAS